MGLHPESRGRLTSPGGSISNTRPEPRSRTGWVTFGDTLWKEISDSFRGVEWLRGLSRLQVPSLVEGAGGTLGAGWLRGAGRLRARVLHFTATCAPAGTPCFHSPPNACARSSRRRRRRSSPRVRTPNRRRPRRLRRRWGRALRTRCQEERLGTRRSITSDSAMLGPEPLRQDDLARPRRPAPSGRGAGLLAPPPGRFLQHIIRDFNPQLRRRLGGLTQGHIYIMQKPTLAGWRQGSHPPWI